MLTIVCQNTVDARATTIAAQSPVVEEGLDARKLAVGYLRWSQTS